MLTEGDEKWMRRALEIARAKGSDPASSPLGSVIVLDGKMIGGERNQTQELPDATAHAEMMAIRRACESIGEMELRGATLYSTLQPCGMCTMASIWSKVGRVVYGAGREDVHAMYFEARHEGTGMSPEILERVTEPFFTTKDQGKGTGLGLSMVYGFMKQSGGALRLYSEEGHGATVRMLFPCANAKADPVGSQLARSLADKRGNETVLVVEDQVDVGDYAETVLSEFGYTVLRAENADEALAVLESDSAVNLLFSDLIMPGGMNGVMLAREVKRRRPNMRILLTTGYAESSIERVDARGAEFELIQKPYKRTELAIKVRQVIDGPTGVS